MKTETIHWLQVFVLIMSTASLAGAIKAYRMGRVFPQMEWGVGAGLVNSLGLISLMAPQVFAPSIPWIRWTGTAVSSALLCLVFVLLRRQRIAHKAATQHLHKVP